MANTLKDKQSAHAAWKVANARPDASSMREVRAQLADEHDQVSTLRSACMELFQNTANPGDKGEALIAILFASDLQDALCRAMDDTPLQCDTDSYLSAVRTEGFEKIFEDRRDGEPIFIFARPDGLILKVDTCQGRRNCAQLYFQLVPNAKSGTPSLSCSKSWEKTADGQSFMVADMDMREMLHHNLRVIKNQGTLLSPWALADPIPDMAYLTTSQDYYAARKGQNDADQDNLHARLEDSLAMTRELRFRALPAWVKEMTGHAPTPPAIIPLAMTPHPALN